MRLPRLAQRELGLACVAILAGAIALAVTARTRATTPLPLPAAVGSYTALAGSSGAKAVGRHTACGGTIAATTIGVAQPTLPCGTRIYLTYRGKRVLTQVIDRDPQQSDRQFDLTEALALRLGLTGVQQVEWSYVRVG
jgi:rare lipoprotein A (peptidoglycan hydrolase)